MLVAKASLQKGCKYTVDTFCDSNKSVKMYESVGEALTQGNFLFYYPPLVTTWFTLDLITDINLQMLMVYTAHSSSLISTNVCTLLHFHYVKNL